ncbi:MAG: hypothetical protein QM754_13190 [Tepidisphaeraceae bacterium]
MSILVWRRGCFVKSTARRTRLRQLDFQLPPDTGVIDDEEKRHRVEVPWERRVVLLEVIAQVQVQAVNARGVFRAADHRRRGGAVVLGGGRLEEHVAGRFDPVDLHPHADGGASGNLVVNGNGQRGSRRHAHFIGIKRWRVRGNQQIIRRKVAPAGVEPALP